MNKLTTIAALPSGSGRAAALPPEVGSTREQWKPSVFPGLIDSAKLAALGYCVNKDGFVERFTSETMKQIPKSSGATGGFCGGVWVPGAKMLPFEPFSYSERN